MIALLDRAILEVRGPEALAFLERLLCNSLSSDQLSYAALLTPQGRIIADMLVYPASAETAYLEVDASLASGLLAKLKMFVLRAPLSLRDVSGELGVAASPSTPQRWRDPRHSALGWRALLPKADLPMADAATQASYRHLCLQQGIPYNAQDMPSGEALPLEHGFARLNGISFSKGCFIGQEVNARLYYRGGVRKQLQLVRCDGPLPAAGTPITQDGQEVGLLRSGAGNLALALLRLDALDIPLTCAGRTLTVLSRFTAPSAPSAPPSPPAGQ